MATNSLPTRLPSLLKPASFSIDRHQEFYVPFGKTCETFKGLKGSSLADATEFMTENMAAVADGASRALLSMGTLETPLGHRITTEEERSAVVEEIRAGLRAQGGYITACEIIARKM